MKCRLTYTSNPNMYNYIGCTGELMKNNSGGYLFKMDNGQTIKTNEVLPNSTLGDVNYSASPSVSFTTKSGTIYDFKNIERERAVDGCFRKDNEYLGFNNDEPDICAD